MVWEDFKHGACAVQIAVTRAGRWKAEKEHNRPLEAAVPTAGPRRIIERHYLHFNWSFFFTARRYW